MSMTWKPPGTMRIAAMWALVMVLQGTAAVGQQAFVDGVWQNEDGEGRVEIAPCAANKELRCGTVVWIKTPLAANGRPVVDAKNPDDALKTRPICGLETLSGLQPTSAGDFAGGRIYDPEEGKTYAGSIKLVGDRLKVTGSIEVPVIGPLSDSETWTRVTSSFTRCSSVAKK